MNRRIFVAIAGIQPEIGTSLLPRFLKQKRVEFVPLRKLRFPGSYTKEYTKRLYRRVTDELRASFPHDRERLLGHATLILFYVDTDDCNESHLFDVFGVEALVVSLFRPGIANLPMVTNSQRNRISNILFDEINRSLGRLGSLLHTIAEEVTNRDNKTILLLPPKTFGHRFEKIKNIVHRTACTRENGDIFLKKIRKASTSLPMRGRYFVGRSGLVFVSPGKSGPRHGLSPTWCEGLHDPSCVVRGRLRFGVSYDPRFHYDCQIMKSKKVILPGCHGTITVAKGQRSVNVAPNDNVRT